VQQNKQLLSFPVPNTSPTLHSFDIHLTFHPIMVHSIVGTLAPCFATVIDEKLLHAATNLHLVIPADNGANLSRFVYMSCHSTGFRSRPVADRTKASYEEKFKQAWAFLAFKGYYESMLLLLPTPPEHCPSMNANLEEFFRFKQQPKDTPLKDERGNPVLDIEGNQILCDGRWKSPYIVS
jgi:hypothetical protein